jgi:hypothetical protein
MNSSMETAALWVDPGANFSCLRLYSAFVAAARVSFCPLNPIKIYATARDFQIACIFSVLGENPLWSADAKPGLIRVNYPIGLGHIPQRIERRQGPGRSIQPGGEAVRLLSPRSNAMGALRIGCQTTMQVEPDGT